MGKRSPSEDSDGSRERRRRKQKRAKAKEKEKEDSDGEGRRKRKKEKRSRSRSAASVDTTPHRCGLGASAARPAAWPRLAGACGSLGSGLAPREASGAPAGRGLSHLRVTVSTSSRSRQAAHLT